MPYKNQWRRQIFIELASALIYPRLFNEFRNELMLGRVSRPNVREVKGPVSDASISYRLVTLMVKQGEKSHPILLSVVWGERERSVKKGQQIRDTWVIRQRIPLVKN